MKKVIVMGASSGIGRELSKLLIAAGYQVGLAARRLEVLEELKAHQPNIWVKQIDATADNATLLLEELIQEMGGLDIYLHCSGMGYQNPDLDLEKDLKTAELNVLAFTKLNAWVFRYFEQNDKGGHLVAISSVAGTRGIGVAASYSASKAYQQRFLEALRQLRNNKGLSKIFITDVRPGFVATPLLKGDDYPMLMQVEGVAQRIFTAIHRRRKRITIDWRYSFLVFFWRRLPSFIWEKFPLYKKPQA